MTTPIFLLSLPRSGSTLVQRVLGSHAEIATASEPWFVLSFVYALRSGGVRAVYDHETLARGVNGFAREYLPDGIDSYRSVIHDAALRLYGEAADGQRYFLDKTPRYGHIAAELCDLFPDAKFIFLWRNPLAIAGSMVETWGKGHWNIRRHYESDLDLALPALVAAYEANKSRSYAIRYEDFVVDPNREIEGMLDYLDLPHDDTLADRFIDLPMRNSEFWDPTGTHTYKSVSSETLVKWKRTMASATRKWWCRRYLERLGSERLSAMGYDYEDLNRELEELGGISGEMVRDLAEFGRARVRRWVYG